MTDRAPAERIAELEARLAMVVEVCSTQRSALMDLLAALEFEFTAMSRAKLLPRGDELNHHFAHFLSRVKDLDITPAEPTVAAYIARVEARGAAREMRAFHDWIRGAELTRDDERDEIARAAYNRAIKLSGPCAERERGA